jgi:FkbM family methyltransferase
MRYRPIVQKNINLIHPLSVVAFCALEKILGKTTAKKLKQKIRILLKAVPEPAVSSKIERIIFDKIKDDVHIVFDVGIQNELSFYKIKNDCDYHLFEPNQKFIKLIKKQILNFTDHRIKLNEFGLSDTNQDDCVYYEESESFIINPAYKDGDTDTGMRYSLRLLDEYVKKNNIPTIDFLKIDTEGFDYKVILGGINTIRENKVSYIQFEFWGNVKKFIDVLSDNFDLYLMWEPRLMKFIEKEVAPTMSVEQKNINLGKSLIPISKELINLIDTKIIPRGAGGNIFGINKKNKNVSAVNLIFDIDKEVHV